MEQCPLLGRQTQEEALGSPGSRLSREFSASKHLEYGLKGKGRSSGWVRLLDPLKSLPYDERHVKYKP